MNEMTTAITNIAETKNLCAALMDTPYYKKLGEAGIFAIVEKARSIGVNPLDGLNGGMYFVDGKVELSAAMMNQLIRQAGHSVTKDKRSDDTVCILHGKRADNGDTWSESFSIADAKLANIYRNTWLKYPRDMLFARALSRLARQLYPDVIKGCYVEGEIQCLDPRDTQTPVMPEEPSPRVVVELDNESISADEYAAFESACGDNDVLRQNLLDYLRRQYGINELSSMPKCLYSAAMQRAAKGVTK